MNLSDRIARLEARLKPNANVPVFIIQMDESRGDSSQPLFTEHAGVRWTHDETAETVEEFKERAKAAALKIFRQTSKLDALWLFVQRPRLTKDQWLAKYGPEKASTP